MAGIKDSYPNLPGHLVELKDGGLQLKTDVAPPSTEAVLLLGTATDGPILQPVSVDPASAESIFGKATYSNGIPNGATLTQGFEEAYGIGCRDIRLMRISGEPATASIGIDSDSITSQVLTSVQDEQLGFANGNDAATYLLKILSNDPANQLDNDSLKITISNIPLILGEAEIPATLETASELSEITLSDAGTLATIDGYFTGADSKEYVITVTAVAESLEASEITLLDGTVITELGGAGSQAFDLGDGLVINIGAGGGDLTTLTCTFSFMAYAAIPATDIIPESGQYHLSETGTSYVLHANVANVGSYIGVAYNYTNASNVLCSVTENGNKTTGAAQVFSLQHAVNDPKAIQLYKNSSIAIDTKDFTLSDDGMSVSLNLDNVSSLDLISANYNYYASDSANPTIDFQSVYGGELYNDLQIEVVNVTTAGGSVIGKEVRITKPNSKKFQVNETPLIYSSLDYPTFDIMVRVINADSKNNVVKASTLFPKQQSSTLKDVLIFNFTDGNDGLNLSKEEMYECLGGKRDEQGNLLEIGVYQLLENYSCDIVIPIGVFADDTLVRKNDNFAYQLALACAVMSHRNRMTTGVIATSSPVDTTLASIEAHVRKLEGKPLNFFMIDRAGNQLKDSDDNLIDLGRFIEVLAGPDLVLRHSRLGIYATNSAPVLGGFVSTLPPQSAPTNKIVTSAKGLRYEFSNGQLDRLAAARYTTFKLKNNGANVAVTDAPTAAQVGSDYTRLSTVRAVKECVDQIREVSDPFIGEPNDVSQRNALSSAISKRLDKLKELGVIQGSEFQIISTLQDQLMGQAKIELTIVPPMELRKITTIVSLKPSL